MNDEPHYEFVNPPLPYPYDALEPYIDVQTMTLHHDRHLATYVNNLNAALSEFPSLHDWSLTKILGNISAVPARIRAQVFRNAGGVFNHVFFFEGMTNPSVYDEFGSLSRLINAEFSSLENFKSLFKRAALSVFGSGYAWLVINYDRRADIIITENQDTPIPLNLTPLLNIDVWEHAYYLKYKNDRAAYIDNWLQTVNWETVSDRLAKGSPR